MLILQVRMEVIYNARAVIITRLLLAELFGIRRPPGDSL